MKKHKDISEAQFIRDLKTVCPDISKEDIDWHVNLSRQTVVEKTMDKELIDLLMWKAGARFEMMNWVNYEKFDYEKFANLIIKECIEIMKEQSYNTSMLTCNPPKSSAIWDACNAIEKKFGVK
jgi:hypothetical protein